MYKSSFILIAVFYCMQTLSQQVVDLTDQTIKIKGGKEEEILFGFAAGDQIVFNFFEENKKELKEVEILEYPNTSKFSDFKTSKIENKKLNVGRTGVYVFRFKNSSLSGRVCKIKIQRIPASEATLDYNSAVTWVTKQDTIWNSFTTDVLVGYDTSYVQQKKKELVRTEKSEVHVFTKSERVHSETNQNGNRTSLFFTLPQNSQSAYQTKKVISWAYWVGVGNEGNEAWKQNISETKKIAQKSAALFTSPLGAIAIGLAAELATPQLGEDVYYAITDDVNRKLFLMNSDNYNVFDRGKGKAGYKVFTNQYMCQGTFFICLENDNFMKGIDVDVKVAAIVETNTYEDKTYTEQVVRPRYEKQIKKEPRIKTVSMPVAGM